MDTSQVNGSIFLKLAPAFSAVANEEVLKLLPVDVLDVLRLEQAEIKSARQHARRVLEEISSKANGGKIPLFVGQKGLKVALTKIVLQTPPERCLISLRAETVADCERKIEKIKSALERHPDVFVYMKRRIIDATNLNMSCGVVPPTVN